jgi:metal-responsive CopG/Arc/MetJ family transcriptional regulator
MSKKFQVTLPDELAHELKREAARRKIPLAEFIRRTMEARLREDRKTNPADPFAGVTGSVDAAETDLAARADEVLYR